VGYIAAFSFAVTGLPIVVGHLLLTDSLLLLLILAATRVLLAIAWDRVTWPRSIGFWLLVGLAVLAKGPAVVPFLGAFALGLLTQRTWRRWLGSIRFWAPLPLALLVGGWWYVYAAVTVGETLQGQFLGQEILDRFTDLEHGNAGPPGAYLLISVIMLLPWTILVPGAVFEAWRDRRVDPAALLVLIWLALPWVFLELVWSKLPHYLLPCYVPLMILFGRMWSRAPGEPGRGQLRVGLIWAGLGVLLGVVVLVAGGILLAEPFGPPLLAVGGVLGIGFAYVARQIWQWRLMAAWSYAVRAMIIAVAGVGLWLLPTLEPLRFSRQLAETVNEHFPNRPGPVFVVGYTEPTLFYYLRAEGRAVDPETASALLADPAADGLLLIRADLKEDLAVPFGSFASQDVLTGYNYVRRRPEQVLIVELPTASQRNP
jgi:4-amino-4-deoxy-L-arabinose transferase-like glycosyltransferase